MTRIRSIAALAVITMLALPSAALALKVNGGTTQLALSTAASNALTANHLTVTPITPATASGSNFTFPISRGRLRKSNLRGVILQQGGFVISNGTRSVAVRHLDLVSGVHGVWLYALVGKPQVKKAGGVVRSLHRVGRVSAITVKNGTATGTVKLTKYSANGINALAGKKIAKAGTSIGTITVTPTFG